ncbi:hypothetical protein KY345_05210 [Candidatus Woesearchaeota archaeon]|nr:hypothetical protein [Candidatus Woesearchaeota archaeon]
MAEIKTIYSELKKKHKDLPNFEDLDNEFEISAIEEPFTLRNIRRKIIEKVEYYAKIIEELLQPETNLINMYETRVFAENEKEDIYNILKKLMFFTRLSAETALKADEKEDVNFLANFLKEWTKLKPSLLNIISRIKDSWEKETELKEDLGYFG